MDSQGWVPIPLIASFNRVKRMTTDVNLVRDALTLSSLVEVHGDHVRLGNGQWRQWILPQAVPSTVENGNNQQNHTPSLEREERSMDEGDEEEEDDVVFVLERQANSVD